MKIDKVMIAGVDHTCDIKELEKLRRQYQFLEWGVLFSKTSQGKLRYPNAEWLYKFHNSITGPMSAHLCGQHPKDILEEGDFSILDNLPAKYTAIQLNYNFEARKSKWKLINLINFLKTTQTHDIKRDVIFQFNRNNEELVRKFRKYPGVRILKDASGGNGVEIKNFDIPEGDNYIGFAGGINPDNISYIMENVKAIDSNSLAWIDLESGVRDKTTNHFSIEKCAQLLGIAAKYLGNENS